MSDPESAARKEAFLEMARALYTEFKPTEKQWRTIFEGDNPKPYDPSATFFAVSTTDMNGTLCGKDILDQDGNGIAYIVVGINPVPKESFTQT